MRNRLTFVFGVIGMIVIAWAMMGLFGVASGSTDDCTRSFKAVCRSLGIGGEVGQ